MSWVKSSHLTRYLAKLANAAPTRCALCAWSHEGTALEGREAAHMHRASKHAVRRRRRASTPTRHPPKS
jgi:AhpD family alkylhydroperoxidase